MKSNTPHEARNISLLKKHHPDLFQNLTNSNIHPVGELVTIEGGPTNLKIRLQDGMQLLLHGQTGPHEDSAQFLNIVPPGASGVVAMIGFGLGVPCLDILKQRPDIRHLVIFEPNIGILKQAVQAYDLSALLSDPRVTFCTDPDPDLPSVFSSASKALELEDIQILRHTPSFKINSGLTRLAEQIFEFLNSFSVRGATTKMLGEKFTRNRFQNLKRFRHDTLVDSMHNIFKDTPAILVAGGPSLDKNLSQLSKLKGKAVIFAVDTVVPTLLANDIVPEFISSIDPQKITLEKYKGADIQGKGISLICSAWVTPRVPFCLPADRVIWTFGGRAIEQWLNKSLGGKRTYIGAGTVAHLNLHVALDMGCSPIVFVGQDLAYSDERDHASNVSLKNNTQMQTTLKTKGDWQWVKGFYGGQVKTSRDFLDNKTVFESIISANPSAEFINATEGGAHIEGTTPLSLKQVIEEVKDKKVHPEQEILSHAPRIDGEKILNLDRELKSFTDTADDILKQIKTSNTAISDARKKVGRLKKHPSGITNFATLPPNVQKKITKIETINAKLDKQGIFWHLLDEVTFKGLQHSEKLRFKMEAESKNKEKYLDWILLGFERLDYINHVRSEKLEWLKDIIIDVMDFHKKEAGLLDDLAETGPQDHIVRKLCRLYFEHGLTSLSMQYMQKIDSFSDDPEMLFIRGCAADWYGDRENAGLCFETAMSLNPSMADQIAEFKSIRAEDYSEFARKWKSIDRDTARTFLCQSLAYNPEKDNIKPELRYLLETDLKHITGLLEKKDIDAVKKTVISWLNDIEANQHLSPLVGGKDIAVLYNYSGDIAAHENNHAHAQEMYLRAIDAEPENAAHYIKLTDVAFCAENYSTGVKALNQAVALDRSNAKYWEMIGDRIKDAGGLDDALAAYEKCFVELPGNKHLLLKISEIYKAMGQTEAALEAERQYEKLTGSDSSNTSH